MELPRLYSPEEVRDVFPEGHRPGLKLLIRKAKQLGCCAKLGHGIGFTEKQVKALLEQLTVVAAPNVSKLRGRVPMVHRTSYEQTRALLEADERKRKELAKQSR